MRYFKVGWMVTKIKDFFYNIGYSITRFSENSRRSLRWAKFMFSNRDFDQHYLYELMYKKLGDMEKCISEGHSMCRKSYARMIKIAMWYLERMIKDDGCKDLWDLFYKKFGNVKMIWLPSKTYPEYSEYKENRFSKCKTKKENDYADKVHLRIIMIEHNKNAWIRKRFFHVFERWHQYWWD